MRRCGYLHLPLPTPLDGPADRRPLAPLLGRCHLLRPTGGLRLARLSSKTLTSSFLPAAFCDFAGRGGRAQRSVRPSVRRTRGCSCEKGCRCLLLRSLCCRALEAGGDGVEARRPVRRRWFGSEDSVKFSIRSTLQTVKTRPVRYIYSPRNRLLWSSGNF